MVESTSDIEQFDLSPILVSITRSRDMAWLRALVSFGVYESVEEAVVDLVHEARINHPGVLIVVNDDEAPV